MSRAHFAAQQSKENEKVNRHRDLIPIASPKEKGNHEDCSEASSSILAFVSQFPRLWRGVGVRFTRHFLVALPLVRPYSLKLSIHFVHSLPQFYFVALHIQYVHKLAVVVGLHLI
jgi:hypothetical protein